MQSFIKFCYGGWVRYALLILCSVYLPNIQAQTLDSRFGSAHTPKGHLHLLVVFVRYDSDPTGTPAWSNSWPDSAILPVFARDSGPNTPNIPGMNQLFTADTTTLKSNLGYQNISQFYYEASGGKFLLTADIYPQQVPISYTGGFQAMNTDALEWIVANDTGFDWGKYDNRTNIPAFQSDNSLNPVPDSILDYVVFVHRIGGSVGAGNGAAATSFPLRSIAGTNYRYNAFHWNVYLHPNISYHNELFMHEFSHNLFHCPHFMGANNRTSGNKYNTYVGWGTIAAQDAPFETTNAWESWYLGWVEPSFIPYGSDTLVYLQDFTVPDPALGNVARSLVIPVDNLQGGNLWIENHQKISMWDKKPFYSTPASRASSPGIYAYVSHPDMGDRSNPLALDVFSGYNSRNADWCNGLKPLHAARPNDLVVAGLPISDGFYAFDRDSTNMRRNPFSGTPPNFIVGQDFNGNGSIPFDFELNSGSGSERQRVFREVIGGVDTFTYAGTGDNRQAFQVGDVIGVSSENPVVPLQKYDQSNQRNQAVPINGLEVKVASYNASTGVYGLHIRFGEYEVSGTQRWCGDLILPDLDGDTLHLHQGDSILLELSGTPDRTTLDPVTGTFANPTRLTLDSASHMHLAEDSRLIVRNHSTLVLKKGSLLEIEDGAVLRIEETGSLIMESGSHILVHDGGEVGILVGGYYRYEDSAQLTLTDDPSCIRIRGEWVIDTSATFTFAGDGFVSLALPNLTAYPDSNVFCRPGAGIRLRGSGPTDKILETDPNSTVNLSSGARLFALENGRVELGQNASLILDEADTTRFHQVDITCKSAPHRFDQVWVVNGDQVEAYQADFQYGQVGLSLYQTSTTPGPVIGIDQSWFTECGIGLATQRVAVDIEHSVFEENTSYGWRQYSGTGTNYAKDSRFNHNDSDGIRYYGEFLDIDHVEANQNGNYGILIKPGLLIAECSELNSNGSAGVFSVFSGGVQLTLSEARYNDVNILLDGVENLLLKNGFNRLWPANGSYLISGTLRLRAGVTTLDATHNRWASSLAVSPVYGNEYVLTDVVSGNPITIFDFTPQEAFCAPSGPGGPIIQLSTGTPPSLMSGSASYSTAPLSNDFQSALQLMRTSNPAGNDLKAVVAWLDYLQGSRLLVSEQRAAHQLLMRAYYAAHTHQDFSTVSDPDSVHLALLSFLQDGLTHSAHYQDSLTFALDQVKVLYTLGDHASALTEISAALPWAQDEAQERLSEWQCLIQGEQNLEAGLLTVSDFHAWRNHCDGASLALRRAAPEKDVPSLPAGLDFQLDLYPNPAQNQVSIKWEQVEPGPLRLQIFSPTGKVIEEIYHSNYLKAGTYIFSLNLAGWKAGMYLVTSQTAEQHLTQKLLVWD